MRLLLDENLSPRLAVKLRSAGYDALAVTEIGLGGSSDSVVRDAAINQDRVLVTLDGDFEISFSFPRAKLPGVIRVKVHPPTESAISEVLHRALSRLETVDLRGKLAVVDSTIIRIRTG